MLKKTPSAIIFDLDGTLVDSALDLTASLNYVLKKAGRQAIDIEHVRNMVGQGARALIVKGFSHTGTLPTDSEIDVLLTEYLDYYFDHISAQTVLFDGLEEVLKSLKQQNIPMAVCTNKVSKLSNALLKNLEIDHYFSAVTCGDSFDFKKPDPRHLLKTCKMIGVDPSKAIMVGDSKIDIDTAIAANIPSIAVSFGYSEIAISALGADMVIDHYDQFMDAAAKLIP